MTRTELVWPVGIMSVIILIIGWASTPLAEELLIKGDVKYLGVRKGLNKFETCERLLIDIGKGRVVETLDQCWYKKGRSLAPPPPPIYNVSEIEAELQKDLQALEQDPGYDNAYKVIEDYNRLAVQKLMEGDWKKEYEFRKKAILIRDAYPFKDDEDWRRYNMLADNAQRIGEYDAAAQAYKKAIDIMVNYNPKTLSGKGMDIDIGYAWNLLGVALWGAGHHHKAIEGFKKSVEILGALPGARNSSFKDIPPLFERAERNLSNAIREHGESDRVGEKD